VRVRVLAAAAAALIAGASGCVMPARSFAAYEGKAVESAKESQSAVGTALLATSQLLDHKTSATAGSVTMSNAEADANAAAASFGSVQPPDHRSDELRSQLNQIEQAATSTITDMRIAARRGDLESLAASAHDLSGVQQQLQKFQQEHQS
jgi:uncharacterized membrane protein